MESSYVCCMAFVEYLIDFFHVFAVQLEACIATNYPHVCFTQHHSKKKLSTVIKNISVFLLTRNKTKQVCTVSLSFGRIHSYFCLCCLSPEQHADSMVCLTNTTALPTYEILNHTYIQLVKFCAISFLQQFLLFFYYIPLLPKCFSKVQREYVYGYARLLFAFLDIDVETCVHTCIYMKRLLHGSKICVRSDNWQRY